MATIAYIQVRKGMVIVEDGQLHSVLDRDLNTPGNWRAILQLKLRNLKTGSIVNKRVHPDNKVEQAELDERPIEYIYQDGDGYVFMDTETYDQFTLPRDWVGEQMLYLKEGSKASVVLHDGKPISLDLPGTVELQVAQTEPARSGSAHALYKAATMETGLTVSVPAFVDVGARIKIDTRTGEYLSRAGP